MNAMKSKEMQIKSLCTGYDIRKQDIFRKNSNISTNIGVNA